MLDIQNVSAAFLIGLFGGLHCVGMCGGIMGALSMAVPPEKRVEQKLLPLLIAYNVGRVLSYAVAGAAVGLFAALLAHYFSTMGFVLRSIAALMLVAMGFYLGCWWSVLRHLEKAGAGLWRTLQPAIKMVMPVDSVFKAMLVGGLWGWLPCGLVYSTLTWSAMNADWQTSSMLMLVFGIGTLPALLASGIALQKLQACIQNRWARTGAACLLILFGIWTFPGVSSWLHGGHQHPAKDSGSPHSIDHSRHQHELHPADAEQKHNQSDLPAPHSHDVTEPHDVTGPQDDTHHHHHTQHHHH